MEANYATRSTTTSFCQPERKLGWTCHQAGKCSGCGVVNRGHFSFAGWLAWRQTKPVALWLIIKNTTSVKVSWKTTQCQQWKKWQQRIQSSWCCPCNTSATRSVMDDDIESSRIDSWLMLLLTARCLAISLRSSAICCCCCCSISTIWCRLLCI